MCLGIPAQIVSLGTGSSAEVDISGVRREVDLTLVPEAIVGDFVLVHVGYAIQRLDEEEARRTLELLGEMVSAIKEVGS